MPGMREITIMEPGTAAAIREGDHTAVVGSISDADTITPEQPMGKRGSGSEYWRRLQKTVGSQLFRHTQYNL